MDDAIEFFHGLGGSLVTGVAGGLFAWGFIETQLLPLGVDPMMAGLLASVLLGVISWTIADALTELRDRKAQAAAVAQPDVAVTGTHSHSLLFSRRLQGTHALGEPPKPNDNPKRV